MTQPPPPPPAGDPLRKNPADPAGAPQDPPAAPGFGPPADAGPPPQQAPQYPPAQPPQGTPPPGSPPAQQPPQQPASSAYGYPQPDAGGPGTPGYGYPQPAPAQPGQPGQPGPYGAPTAPGGYGQAHPGPPYGPPGGYGTPAPNPYGAAPGPAPYGQGHPGPYGQPTQPQPAVARSGGFSRTQSRIAIAAAVAIVLIIGAGVGYATFGDDEPAGKNGKRQTAGSSAGASGGTGGGDGGKEAAPADGPGREQAPANTASRVAFQLPELKVTDTTTVKGSWLTDKAFVKPGVDSLTGYDRDKGTPLWKLPLSGQICGASRHRTEDHRTAILFEPARRTGTGLSNYQPCTQIGAVDLTTGKLLWTASVTSPLSGDRKIRFSEVTLSGTTVAAGGLDGGAAFDLATGAVRWKPRSSDRTCRDMGYGGGPALVAVRKCGEYGNEKVTVQRVDPVSGSPLFSYELPAGVEYASVVSSKPLVIAADVGDTGRFGISDFFSVDERGTLLTKISATGEKFDARCRSTEVESCTKIAVGNGRIYLATDPHTGSSYGRTNEIVSYDLRTGKPLPGRAEAGEKYTMFPFRMDGGHVLAYKQAPYDKGGQVVSIHGGTLKTTVLMENPSDRAVKSAEGSFTADYSEFLYGDGRLYLSGTMASKTRTGASYGVRPLAMAFATGG
jgi:outer membrane protein assembly factor BamB